MLGGSLLYATSLFAWCVSDEQSLFSVWSAVLLTPLFGLPFLLAVARRHIFLWLYFVVLLAIVHAVAVFAGFWAGAAIYAADDDGSLMTFGLGALCGAIGGLGAFAALLPWRAVPKTRAALTTTLAGAAALAAIGGLSTFSLGYAMQILPGDHQQMTPLDVAFAQVWIHLFWQIAFAWLLAFVLTRPAPIDEEVF
jgi:hypothetical protein